MTATDPQRVTARLAPDAVAALDALAARLDRSRADALRLAVRAGLAALGELPPPSVPMPAADVSRLLRELQAAGWTLAALAQRVGLSHATLSRWATGARKPGRGSGPVVAELRALSGREGPG